MNLDSLDNDLFAEGISEWGQRVRRGELTFAQTTQFCIDKISANASLNT